MTDLREARENATRAKIALRHAEDDAGDYLTWFDGQHDYTALGRNDPARKKAHAEILSQDAKAVQLEERVRLCQDTKDLADCELECLFDDIKESDAKTWATLADWTQGRTASGRMGSQKRAGKEILEKQVEDTLAEAIDKAGF